VIDQIEIRWPSGELTKLAQLQADQILAIEEGKGLVRRPFPLVLKKAP
jgi:hypothetical protein